LKKQKERYVCTNNAPMFSTPEPPQLSNPAKKKKKPEPQSPAIDCPLRLDWTTLRFRKAASVVLFFAVGTFQTCFSKERVRVLVHDRVILRVMRAPHAPRLGNLTLLMVGEEIVCRDRASTYISGRKVDSCHLCVLGVSNATYLIAGSLPDQPRFECASFCPWYPSNSLHFIPPFLKKAKTR
jgi:hypothetical protein